MSSPKRTMASPIHIATRELNTEPGADEPPSSYDAGYEMDKYFPGGSRRDFSLTKNNKATKFNKKKAGGKNNKTVLHLHSSESAPSLSTDGSGSWSIANEDSMGGYRGSNNDNSTSARKVSSVNDMENILSSPPNNQFASPHDSNTNIAKLAVGTNEEKKGKTQGIGSIIEESTAPSSAAAAAAKQERQSKFSNCRNESSVQNSSINKKNSRINLNEMSRRKSNNDLKKETAKRKKERAMKHDAQSGDFDIGFVAEQVGKKPPLRDSCEDSSTDYSHNLRRRFSQNLEDHSEESLATQPYNLETFAYNSRGEAFDSDIMESNSSLPEMVETLSPNGSRYHHHHHHEKSTSTLKPVPVLPDVTLSKHQRIQNKIEECERSDHKRKKLILSNLGMTLEDIPEKMILSKGTNLCQTLHKLGLSGNRLYGIPSQLVLKLSNLKTLDVSQCNLTSLPEKWDLPNLRILDLSHNALEVFPSENILVDIPSLKHLNLYGNKVCQIDLPQNMDHILNQLEYLNLGYNEIFHLPDEIGQISSLRTFLIMNNKIEIIPQKVCEMDLKELDVSLNPLVQPPVETCERGIKGMKRYYQCLAKEENARQQKLMKQRIIRQKSSISKRAVRKKKKHTRSTSVPNPVGKDDMLDTSTLDSPSSQPSLQTLPPMPSSPLRWQESLEPIGDLPSRNERAAIPQSVDEEVRLTRRLSSLTINSGWQESLEPIGDLPSRNERAAIPQSVDGLTRRLSSLTINSEVNVKETSSFNDTLKVIFVGMAHAGKTSIIKKLKDGPNAKIPKIDERTVGVEIHKWTPCKHTDGIHIKTQITVDENLDDIDIQISMWDFAGQHVYHAAHELFFSQRALYVVVWDMGVNNSEIEKNKREQDDYEYDGEFALSDSEDEVSHCDSIEEERAKKALEREIEDKVQFWVDSIQNCVPGSAILIVASHDDLLTPDESRRRCTAMQKRIEQNEEKRKQYLMKKLERLKDEKSADTDAAQRLRDLCFIRPKLLFGQGDDPDENVLRVSSKNYLGFGRLAERIVHIATGREQCGERYPLFRGHVGARIPKMRLEVRDTVRDMRKKLKVAEWGQFMDCLVTRRSANDDDRFGIDEVDDVSDALHFLSEIGEISYFSPPRRKLDGTYNLNVDISSVVVKTINEEDSSEQPTLYALKNESRHVTNSESMRSTESTIATSLVSPSEYIFLNPRWLMSAVSCILRDDIKQKIARKDKHHSCPLLSSEEADKLWEQGKHTKNTAKNIMQYSQTTPSSLPLFEFLKELLVQFKVFVPMDSHIETAQFSGNMFDFNTTTGYQFFLPSFLGDDRPADNVWDYKNSDPWKETLCHSIFFPDTVPAGLMERIIASILSDFFRETKIRSAKNELKLKQILCWRTTLVLLASLKQNDKRFEIELFVHMAEREDKSCVASKGMDVGTQRLIISGKGHRHSNVIWEGGFGIICRAVNRVLEDYKGLEFEEEGICSECLRDHPKSEAGVWESNFIKNSTKKRNLDREEPLMRCSNKGHFIDRKSVNFIANKIDAELTDESIVLVGLWDCGEERIIGVGSGFIVDKKLGLVMTCAHTLISLTDEKSKRKFFGKDYYGCEKRRVIIGINTKSDNGRKCVAFRYFASIVGKDENMEENRVCRIDACILQIKTRMENDVYGDGEGCGKQIEQPVNGKEELRQLKMEKECVNFEDVEARGFNQNSQKNLRGEKIAKEIDVVYGIVTKANEKQNVDDDEVKGKYLCKPISETTIECKYAVLNGGHSGGPIFNKDGKVVAMISRTDHVEKNICYAVPSTELVSFLKRVKKRLRK